MERLKLLRPRDGKTWILPLSAALPIGVHWHHRSHLCANKEHDCRLCSLVPRRAVVYFAAATRSGSSTAPVTVGILERSSAWYAEACRQSGTNWQDVLGRLKIAEKVSGRDREVQSTALQDSRSQIDLVSVEELAWAVAALYRLPQFPRCTTVSAAQRCLSMFAERQHSLLLGGATEVAL